MLPIVVGLLVLSLLGSGALLALLLKLSRTVERAGDVSLASRCDSIEAGQKRLEELLRSEMALNRREVSETLVQNRDALASQINGTSEALNTLRNAVQLSLNEVFSRHRELQAVESKKYRDEVTESIRTQNELLLVQHKNALETQTASLQAVEEHLRVLIDKSRSENGLLREGLIKALDALRTGLTEKIAAAAVTHREQNAADAKLAREEVVSSLQSQGDALLTQLKYLGDSQVERLSALQLQAEKYQTEAGQLRQNVIKALEALRIGLLEKMTESANIQREGHASDAKLAREEAALSIKTQGDTLLEQLKSVGENQRERLTTMNEFLATLSRNHKTEATTLREGLAGAIAEINAILREQTSVISKGQTEQTSVIAKGQTEQIAAVTQSLESFAAKVHQFEAKTESTLEKMREGVEKRLGDLQQNNEQKLEEMRATVDEKLHSTLEKRLGESFARVVEGLTQVQHGLGEMKALANGVGDLKKVLSNVKTRGTWGEVQLGNLLGQIMAPSQFATNVAVTNGRERVEFAIKLPGRDDSQDQIWLPIDAKFPQESYGRLVAAEDAGDMEARDRASKELEDVVKRCAQDVSKKYISPPLTTDFALLYLPTEGLYAEVVKRTGLIEYLHQECRVIIAGPTTIAALLNSLQMGFRTLELQKNSSKINDVLVSVKTEFTKYAGVLDKIKKNLDTAQNTVEDAQKRTRILTRTLDKIEAVESGPVTKNLILSAAEPGVEFLDLELSESD